MIIFTPIYSQKATLSNTGLEVLNHKTINIVTIFDQDQPKLDITEERLQAKVELYFRKNGITPKSTSSFGESIVIVVHLVDIAISVTVKFERWVEFKVGKQKFETLATTWEKRATGHSSYKSDLVYQTLEELLDYFLND